MACDISAASSFRVPVYRIAITGEPPLGQPGHAQVQVPRRPSTIPSAKYSRSGSPLMF
jgi:hypothetical protein